MTAEPAACVTVKVTSLTPGPLSVIVPTLELTVVFAS